MQITTRYEPFLWSIPTGLLQTTAKIECTVCNKSKFVSSIVCATTIDNAAL